MNTTPTTPTHTPTSKPSGIINAAYQDFKNDNPNLFNPTTLTTPHYTPSELLEDRLRQAFLAGIHSGVDLMIAPLRR